MQHSLDSMIPDRQDLLAFGGLAHDPQGVLTAVYQFALVRVKLCLNIVSRRRKAGLELGIAVFAYADGRGRASFYDPQASLLHDASLAHLRRGRRPCGNQTAPLP